jgi:hypothetical protein
MDTSKSQSLLVDELANVIDTLHGLFDEIGLTRYERENQESTVYAAISAALHEQLRLVSEYVLSPPSSLVGAAYNTAPKTRVIVCI